MDNTPKVSILMGVYNCVESLEESVESILSQTFTDWELIICDDGSGDGTFELAKKLVTRYPGKIVLVNNTKNMGLAFTLNHCLRYAKGKYIARQDGDDISLSNRLQQQFEFLENNPQYALVSSSMILFDENSNWGKVSPIERPQKCDFVKGTPFAHAASMIRKESILSIGGYRNLKKTLRVEDYDLWFRMYEKGYLGYNFTQALYKARDDRNAIARRRYRYRFNEVIVRYEGFKRLNLSAFNYVYIFKPLIVGLVPTKIYKLVRSILHGA